MHFMLFHCLQITVIHTASCESEEATDAATNVLQLLASQGSGQLYSVDTSSSDLPVILNHHLNISGSLSMISLVNFVFPPGTQGSRYAISSADKEFFISVVCEDGNKPQIRTQIRQRADRDRLQTPSISSVYLARLRNPTPTEFAFYLRSRSSCRLRISVLSELGEPVIRFARQEELAEDGVPLSSTHHPVPGMHMRLACLVSVYVEPPGVQYPYQ